MGVGLPRASHLLARLHTAFLKETKAHEWCRTSVLFVQHTNCHTGDRLLIRTEFSIFFKSDYKGEARKSQKRLFASLDCVFYYVQNTCIYGFLIECFSPLSHLCSSMLPCLLSHPMSTTQVKKKRKHFLNLLSNSIPIFNMFILHYTECIKNRDNTKFPKW